MTTDQIEKQFVECADFHEQAAYIKKNLVSIQETYTAKNAAINARLEGKIGPDDLEQRSRVRLNAIDRLKRQTEIKGFDAKAVELAIVKSAKEERTNEETLAAINKAKKLTLDTPMHEQVLVTVFQDMVSALQV